jgi:hypothetical protein
VASRSNAAIYAIVMTGLITLNALLWAFTDADFPWAAFPLVGWGIGLTFHYIDAYRREGRSIRDRQREMELRGTDEGTRLTVAGFQTRPQVRGRVIRIFEAALLGAG